MNGVFLKVKFEALTAEMLKVKTENAELLAACVNLVKKVDTGGAGAVSASFARLKEATLKIIGELK